MLSNVEIKVKRMHKLPNGRGLKAFVDIVVNDTFLIKSVKVLEGKNGLFVSMPQEKAKDNKWYDSVRCLNPEVSEHLSQEVLAAYAAESN